MENEQYKRLDILLSEITGKSREFSKELITTGKVKVDNKVILKSGLKIDPTAKIVYDMPENIYVSRGGYKLKKAIEVFNIDLNGKICLDIGASTGGFTDCMLQNGAEKVFAIDTGTGQLSDQLLNNNKVVSMEKTNINNIDKNMLCTDIDFISVDVSFVSLTKIMEKVYSFCNDKTKCIFLVKPQFEVGKGNVSRKGIVKNPKAHINILKKITDFSANQGFCPTEVTSSPILGSDGNKEFLLFVDCGKKDGNIHEIYNTIHRLKDMKI